MTDQQDIVDVLEQHPTWGRSTRGTLVCGGPTCAWEQPWPPDVQAGCRAPWIEHVAAQIHQATS